MNNNKLFIVEFGEPQVGLSSFSFIPEPAVYVIAKDYNDAATKAIQYAENIEKNEPNE